MQEYEIQNQNASSTYMHHIQRHIVMTIIFVKSENHRVNLY